jgi:U3 small nucleolar RNA-associated protein 14
MDAPNMTQQVPERQRKRKLPQVLLQDNLNPVDLIKSQETLASSTKSLAEDISEQWSKL